MTAKWQYKEAYEAALVTARELKAENAKLQASNEVIAEDHAALCEHNAKLRKLVRDIYGEYRYLRVRFHRTYVQHEERMRAVERDMRELGIEVGEAGGD